MTNQYEYFVEPEPEGRPSMSEALWRCLAEAWEYFSVLDWSWHLVELGTGVSAPVAEQLRAVTADEAAALMADRQHWVRYWARYLDPPTSTDRPLTVVRRRSSPERVLDESYTVRKLWEPTDAIVEAESNRPSDPPHLVEVDQPTAERILQEVRGVEGETRL